MGIEEIQRINALARELMRHGIAQTSDEALLKAEEMLRGNGVSSMTAAITSNIQTGKPDAAHINQGALSELNMDVRSLGVRFESLVRELLSVKEEIKKLGSGLGDVNKQVMGVRLSLEQQRSSSNSNSSLIELHHETAAVQQQVQQQAQQQPVQHAVAAARESPRMEQPRVTATARPVREEYKPEDVAIEKIFYFGKS